MSDDARDTGGTVSATATEEARELAEAGRLSSAPEDGAYATPDPEPTYPQPELPSGPSLGLVGWLRWFWRQLTSMRIALILLFLLSLVAIPGSIIPQQPQDPDQVSQFHKDHTTLAPLYDHLGLFDVFGSFWFAAIYILLFISLAGCIVPRCWQFVRALRAQPPKAPRNLSRLPEHTSWVTDAKDTAGATEAARTLLAKRHYRARLRDGAVSAEKGFLREVGNLLFHTALFGLLFAIAAGSLWGAKGGKLVTEGEGFANTLTQYDDFDSGPLYNVGDLDPFSFQMHKFTAKYQRTGPQRGTATTFKADIDYTVGADGTSRNGEIAVNHPLEIKGTKIYLLSHGYAPVVTVRDARGEAVYRGAAPFMQQDKNFTSSGVIKVPDDYHNAKGKKEQLGFSGQFVPSFQGADPTTGMRSAFPAADNPALFLTAFHGDLGTDYGVEQSVYQLDNSHMTQFKDDDGRKYARKLVPGQTAKLPSGNGSITYEGTKQWASFQISHNPGTSLALWSSVAAVLGLLGSLFIRRRRVWVRAEETDDGLVRVRIAGLGRGESAKLADDVRELSADLRRDLPEAQERDVRD